MNKSWDFIEAKARSIWDNSHSSHLSSRLYGFLFRIRPPTVVWIEQYDSGDWDQANCMGSVIKCWQYDALGLSPINEIGEIDFSSPTSLTPNIRFFVDPEEQRMIYTVRHGPRSGYGAVLKFHEGRGWTSEEGTSWVS